MGTGNAAVGERRRSAVRGRLLASMHCEIVRLGASQRSTVPAGFYVVLRSLGVDRRGCKGRSAWYGPFASRRVAETLRVSAFFLGARQAVQGAPVTQDDTTTPKQGRPAIDAGSRPRAGVQMRAVDAIALTATGSRRG